MIELVTGKDKRAIELYNESFYKVYNGAHDSFIDDSLTDEEAKIFDLLKDARTAKQKAEAVDLFQTMLFDHCKEVAALETNWKQDAINTNRG